MKMKVLACHELEDVPDHLIQEIAELAEKIAKAIGAHVEGVNYNVVLAAIGRVHAVLIKTCISDDPEELKKAARAYAWNLVKDIERIGGIKIFEEET